MSWLDASEDILVVDDEPAIADVIALYLKREGWSVRIARDGRAALAAITERLPALVILDLNLPELHGLKILQHVRSLVGAEVLVIILTDHSREEERIRGLQMGADDYVSKPFSTAELVSRVKALLRRARGGKSAATNRPRPLQFTNLTIDPTARTVTVYGREVQLTANEFDLLYFLARHPSQIFTLEQLIAKVWDYTVSPGSNTVYVHMRRLRQKVEPDPKNPLWLHTVWGVGYKFEDSHQ